MTFTKQCPITSPWDADQLRTVFVQALSNMYREEVPLYGKLVDIVRTVDSSVLEKRGQNLNDLPIRHQLERHGAIRLGTTQEMRQISRLFAIIGMHPVGYYNLEMVGFPLYGTAFRPTNEDSLRRNPFRVFTTVLRPDLIVSLTVREIATEILSRRELFSSRLCELMDQAEQDVTKLTQKDADEMIVEALKVFKWHSRSTVPLETYLSLKQEHPIVADIVCFPSAHINHLTPRTLDIDAIQLEMIRQGLPAKECIEGPPAGRKCAILLRQTSFKALEEQVVFSGSGMSGTHTARFGEVEQRGAAVTRKGRDLYDRLLAAAVDLGNERGQSLNKAFQEYPDDWTELRKQGLVYFRYRVPADVVSRRQEPLPTDMEALLQAGIVECEPITYEDFLPFSAAGIFASNLADTNGTADRKLQATRCSSRAELEDVLGQEILSEIDVYEDLQKASVDEVANALGLKAITLAGQ